MYLNIINHFRAFEIIFIVLGHCSGLANFTFDNAYSHTFENFILGGTTFFVFISGFLFHHVFYGKFK